MNPDFTGYKKICIFVAETFPSTAGGGLNAFRFAKFLSQASGNPVDIVCYNYNGKLPENESYGDVNINRISYFNSNIFTKLFSLPVLVFNYLRFVLRSSIVIIYGRYLAGYELIIFFSLLLKKKIVFRSTLLYDDDINTILSNGNLVLKHLRTFLFKRLSLYFAINTTFAEIWGNKFGANKLFGHSQGVDTDFFEPADKKKFSEVSVQLNIKDNIPIILSAGILIERKGYRKIFDQLAQVQQSFVYLIAGVYQEEVAHRSSSDELKEMAELKKYGEQLLGDKLILLGKCLDILPYYNLADIFIHGSLIEGTPNVILEAMSCQLPVISYAFPGAEYIIKNHENGRLISDFNQLSTVVSELIIDKNKRESYALNARRSMVNFHSMQSLSDKLLQKLYA